MVDRFRLGFREPNAGNLRRLAGTFNRNLSAGERMAKEASIAWWRNLLLPKHQRIMDVANWQERWKGKEYKTPQKVKPILKQLQKTGVDADYVEWLLRPENYKGRKEHPESRLPEKAQSEVLELFRNLDATLKTMRLMVDEQILYRRAGL
jgi:hypothetical protein